VPPSFRARQPQLDSQGGSGLRGGVVDEHEPRPAPLADVEEGWYFPADGESAPLGRDADGNVHEPGPRDLYAVLLRPAR
jgi:hypothetical protein